MAFDSPAPINRRTVAKGIAWSVPAVAIAGAAPAFALSGQPPKLTFLGACKFPGNNCGGTVKQAYGFRFKVTNDSLNDVYFCDAWLSDISDPGLSSDELVWKHDGCVTVPAGQTGSLSFFFEYTKSPNLSFTAKLNVEWAHDCPCTEDGYPHTAIREDVNVTDTPPGGACSCNSDFV